MSTAKKKIVWRCISRLDHGSRYCKNSPSIHEEPLQKAIVDAINEYHGCAGEIAGILKAGTEAVLTGQMDGEVTAIEKRLAEIDKARNDMIGLIVSGTVGSDALDAEFQKLHDEEERLSKSLKLLKEQSAADDTVQKQIDAALSEITAEKFTMTEYDDVIVRRLLECIRVIDKSHLQIIFKGGYEVTVTVDKK